MALALDEPKDTDQTVELEGITYVVDKELVKQVEEVKVDFAERGWRAGFIIETKQPIGFDIPTCGGSCSC